MHVKRYISEKKHCTISDEKPSYVIPIFGDFSNLLIAFVELGNSLGKLSDDERIHDDGGDHDQSKWNSVQHV